MPRHDDLREVFKRRLADARALRGLSQKQLGIDAGLDPFVASARINRYELGVHEPDLATIQRLAFALDVPCAYLFAEDERLARVILTFDAMTDTQRNRLLRQLAEP